MPSSESWDSLLARYLTAAAAQPETRSSGPGDHHQFVLDGAGTVHAGGAADRALAARVKEALLAEKSLNAHGIDVGAKNGTVTLFGTVENKTRLEQAAKIAAGVDGARSVENKLVVVSGS